MAMFFSRTHAEPQAKILGQHRTEIVPNLLALFSPSDTKTP